MRQNRVAPTGEILAIGQRGAFLGNRGALTRAGAIVRPWQVRRWITCLLEFRGWRAPAHGTDGLYTPLFFLDEAVALAAGHRPCATCRHRDFEQWRTAWEAGVGPWRGTGEADRLLHADRVDAATRAQRVHQRPWTDLPDGAFVRLDDGRPARVDGDQLRPWLPGPAGYGLARGRPRAGAATVLTPSCTVEVLLAGYVVAART